MKVFVYFNLHKRVFSVKALEGAEKLKFFAIPPVAMEAVLVIVTLLI